MEEQEKIPYFVFEGVMSRAERTIRRLWILCICLLIALLATNAGWIWYESQYEYYDEEVYQEVTQSAESAEGDAINKFVGGDLNVEVESDDNNND